MGEFGAKRLNECDLDEVPLQELEAHLCGHAALVAAETAAFLRVLAAFDRREGWHGDGVRSLAHWLNWKVGISMRTAHEHVRVAQALADLPLISDAFGRGELSYSRVRAITRIASPEVEDTLVDLAMSTTASQLEKVVQLELQLRAAADREAPYIAPSCTRSSDRFGREVIRAAMDPSDADLVWKAIDAATCTDTERSIDERRSDALAAICDSYLAGLPEDRSGKDRTRISVVRHETCGCDHTEDDEDAVVGGPGLPALDSGRPLPQAELDLLECDASWAEVVIDEERIAQIGKTTAGISATLRRQLIFRDGGCIWPGCGADKHLHAHHVKFRSHGGPTELPNLVLLCNHHHRVLHRSGYSLSRSKGRWTVIRPNGTVIEHRPMRLTVPPGSMTARLPAPETIVSRWDGTPLDLHWWEPMAAA